MANNAQTEQRVYRGKIDAEDMARALVLEFNAGDTQAQWTRGEGGRAVVQVSNRQVQYGDPTTTVAIYLTPSASGMVVAVSEQKLFGVAADLAKSGVKALLNPLSLLGELDDIARNVRSLSLRQEVWTAVEAYCRNAGAGIGAGRQLEMVVCSYCGTPNDIGALNCRACRAPLADAQPVTCGRCGSLNDPQARNCVNCGAVL